MKVKNHGDSSLYNMNVELYFILSLVNKYVNLLEKNFQRTCSPLKSMG